MESSADVAVLLERLGRILQNDAHVEGLKPTQWEALRYLARANRFSRNPSALTSYLGTTKGTVSQTLNALERKALIRKKAGSPDRRQVRLEVTAKGRKALECDPIETTTRSISALSKDEQQRLSQGLEALLKGALDERDGRPFGVCQTCRFFRENDPEGGPHRCSLLDLKLSDDDSELICAEHDSG